MIYELTGRAKRLFIPRDLINSIVRWICGIHSQSGTVTITNTTDPGRTSASIDVNLTAVARAVNKLNGGRQLSRKDVAEIVSSRADGHTITSSNGMLSVNIEWLRQFLKTDDSEGVTRTIEVSGPPSRVQGSWRYTFPIYTLEIKNGVIVNIKNEADAYVDIA